MHSTAPDAPLTSAPRPLRGLLMLNGALLILLAAVTFAGSAEAQNRGRGDYTMVGGGANGAQSSVVYIVDADNQELIAINYNTQTRTLDGVGYRNLATDAADATRPRTGN